MEIEVDNVLVLTYTLFFCLFVFIYWFLTSVFKLKEIESIIITLVVSGLFYYLHQLNYLSEVFGKWM